MFGVVAAITFPENIVQVESNLDRNVGSIQTCQLAISVF
jgi:hypothetical protein